MALRVSSKLFATLLVSAGAVVLFFNDPSTHAFYPRCVFHAITGLDCPGCGATRALYHLLHGELRTSLHYNAMLLPMLGVVGVSVSRPRFIERPWFLWSLIAMLSIWWVVRNLPITGGW